MNKLSVYTLGTYQFYDKEKLQKSEIQKIIFKSVDRGINLIDTADSYGEGKCEAIIGNILKDNNLSNVGIATKIGQLSNFKISQIQNNIDNSLRRLKKEYLDICYFHSGNNTDFFNDDYWNIMNKNLENGKIKKLGLSLKTAYLKKNNFEQIKKSKKYNITVINLMFNPIICNGNLIFNFCKKNNLDIIGRSPFLGGDIFREKYRKIVQKKLKINDEKKYIKNILKWIKSHKSIKSIVFGVRSLEQLKLFLKNK